jgi:hypothetical protein
MSLDVKSTRARLDLLPGYPNPFDVMFDSVKIESSPVEAKDDCDSTESDFSDDEEEETGYCYEECLGPIRSTVYGVPCDQCTRFVANSLSSARAHCLKLKDVLEFGGRCVLTELEVGHIQSCLLGFYYSLL